MSSALSGSIPISASCSAKTGRFGGGAFMSVRCFLRLAAGIADHVWSVRELLEAA
jgi:hypothetical protein